MAANTILGKVLKLSQDFVAEKAGVWNHQDWEAFCSGVAKAGLEMSEANQAALGTLLESMKHFHAIAPAKKAPAKKAPAKAAAKSPKKAVK